VEEGPPGLRKRWLSTSRGGRPGHFGFQTSSAAESPIRSLPSRGKPQKVGFGDSLGFSSVLTLLTLMLKILSIK
jgi:hypothetical protein